MKKKTYNKNRDKLTQINEADDSLGRWKASELKLRSIELAKNCRFPPV
jgi:hypothetical protein